MMLHQYKKNDMIVGLPNSEDGKWRVHTFGIKLAIQSRIKY